MPEPQRARRVKDGAFQQRIDDIRARYRVSDAARRRTRLRRAANEWKGLCPFHQEKSPSFYVNDAKAFAHCFGCGWHGDVIRFVQDSERVSFLQALDMLDGGTLPAVDPIDMARARDDDAQLDAEAVREALMFWEEAGPVVRTPADFYLSWRKIFIRPPEIRFGRIPTWKNPRTGHWNACRPALILRAENLAGEFVGIQRIFLTEDGGKAPMGNPKLTLGRIRAAGGAVRFGRPSADAGATGSSEDALTLYQRFDGQLPIYLSCGESNLPFLRLPRLVRSVTLFGQNDAAGRRAILGARTPSGNWQEGAKQALEAQGKLVRPVFPPTAFKDWNDLERGIRMEAARA